MVGVDDPAGEVEAIGTRAAGAELGQERRSGSEYLLSGLVVLPADEDVGRARFGNSREMSALKDTGASEPKAKPVEARKSKAKNQRIDMGGEPRWVRARCRQTLDGSTHPWSRSMVEVRLVRVRARGCRTRSG